MAADVEMHKTTLRIPLDVFQSTKKLSVDLRKDLQDVVTIALREYLARSVGATS